MLTHTNTHMHTQFHLNGGRPVATSIPATEHSVMTAWPTEAAAISNMVEHFGSGLFACVMDSYDYAAALSEVLPSIASKKVSRSALIVTVVLHCIQIDTSFVFVADPA